MHLYQGSSLPDVGSILLGREGDLILERCRKSIHIFLSVGLYVLYFKLNGDSQVVTYSIINSFPTIHCLLIQFNLFVNKGTEMRTKRLNVQDYHYCNNGQTQMKFLSSHQFYTCWPCLCSPLDAFPFEQWMLEPVVACLNCSMLCLRHLPRQRRQCWDQLSMGPLIPSA